MRSIGVPEIGCVAEREGEGGGETGGAEIPEEVVEEVEAGKDVDAGSKEHQQRLYRIHSYILAEFAVLEPA
jgi:hypothetical protein